jgi:protein-tyrosine phosphatase
MSTIINGTKIKIDEFGQVDSHVFRGARPKEKEFKNLKAIGVSTVIDLTDNTPKEKGYVESLGMKYINIPIKDKTAPDIIQVFEVLQALDSKEVVFIHCAGGKHRTGIMIAVYRLKKYHYTFDQAYVEMKQYGFYSSGGHDKQLKFIQQYYKDNK